jgi:site-specific DNA-cytosine methylase
MILKSRERSIYTRNDGREIIKQRASLQGLKAGIGSESADHSRRLPATASMPSGSIRGSLLMPSGAWTAIWEWVVPCSGQNAAGFHDLSLSGSVPFRTHSSSPTCQSYRVLNGQEPEIHFGLARLDPEKPCPTIQKSSPQSSTTGLIHQYEVRHLTISKIKRMSSFPDSFRIEGSVIEKWARIGGSLLLLLAKAIADCLCSNFQALGKESLDWQAQ